MSRTYPQIRLGAKGTMLLAVAAAIALSGSIDRLRSADEAAEGGVIEGVVVYEYDSERPWRYARYYVQNQKTGELSEAVVCLTDKSLRNLNRRSAPAQAEMDQKDYRFQPETLAVRAGDSVKFTNSDPAAHNVRTDDGADPFNVSMGADGSHVQQFRRAGGVKRPIRIGCALHSTMRAWIFVFDHPFYAVTSTDGAFRFEDVPPGEYNISMLHPSGDLEWTGTVEVSRDETSELEIRVSPDNLVKENR